MCCIYESMFKIYNKEIFVTTLNTSFKSEIDKQIFLRDIVVTSFDLVSKIRNFNWCKLTDALQSFTGFFIPFIGFKVKYEDFQ